MGAISSINGSHQRLQFCYTLQQRKAQKPLTATHGIASQPIFAHAPTCVALCQQSFDQPLMIPDKRPRVGRYIFEEVKSCQWRHLWIEAALSRSYLWLL